MPMPTPLSLAHQRRILSHYFFLTYLVVLLITMDSVAYASAYADGISTFVFMLFAHLCYGVYYLIPALLITAIVNRISNWRAAKGNAVRSLPAYITAVATGGLTTLLLYANAKLFALYGMFFNGFIINLVMTPGGIQSLGGSSASDVGFALIAAGFFLLQAILLWLVYLIYRRTLNTQLLPARLYVYTSIVIILSTLGVHLTYAANNAFNHNTLVSLAETVPFFHPVTSRSLFRTLGYHIKRDTKLEVRGRLHYPLQPLQFKQPAKPYNIVWLAAESWRADMLDEEIMPSTWKFAAQANRFNHNYSGGNGTRMGIFSMFMGIPGNYWFPFMQEHRGAAIIDVLQKQGYQMNLYTSARFSYPEFDKTIFSQVPADQLHSLDDGRPGWERDRANVASMLDFIDKRDRAKPFFTFMFFESPHARYFFPPESVIRRPYRDDINYASLSKKELDQDIVSIKNRYINAVHHLDSQFDRVFSYLKAHDLLDNTIVILLGDHGEEFMERGYWGHNSTFVDQQIRTPLVIWAPGMAAKVHDEMSSHMDIPATLMPLLGVANPASDYSTGQNLFNGPPRTHTYVSDWSRIAYIDHDVKIVQPVNIQGYVGNRITASNDDALTSEQASALMQKKQPAMLQLIHDLSKFMDKKGSTP